MLKTGMQGPVWALGAMSGTSLDGVDAAMVLTDGERVLEFGPAAFRPYTPAEAGVIRAALGRWPGEAGVAEAARWSRTPMPRSSAGLTVPRWWAFTARPWRMSRGGRGTHQAGNGALLAEVLGLPVVWDFRSADVALGGQGAPLVPYYHFALAKRLGADAPLVFLNLGGVGNVTWVDPRQPAPEVPDACLAFDTGPANAPVNDLMLARRGLIHDDGGALAATGRADAAVIARFLAHPHFARMPPKSLDRNDFAGLLDAVSALSDPDAAATLTRFAAEAVAAGAQHYPQPPARMLVAGGGRHNSTLMAELRALHPFSVQPVGAVGLDGDMLEAQAFAHLAVRVARGLPTSGPSTTGVAALVGGGQISRP